MFSIPEPSIMSFLMVLYLIIYTFPSMKLLVTVTFLQPPLKLQAPTLANYLFRMGELEPWIDENFIRSVWFGMGEQVNVKMIRDKFSG